MNVAKHKKRQQKRQWTSVNEQIMLRVYTWKQASDGVYQESRRIERNVGEDEEVFTHCEHRVAASMCVCA